MISALCLLLIHSFAAGPTGVLSWVAFFLCCLPFFLDMLLSLRTAYVQLFADPSDRPQSCTVTELSDANEENFLPVDSQGEQRRQQRMYEPSERLMPSALANIEPLNRLVTSNWRENAVSSANTTHK